jgi:PRTRC genetic system protein A
VSEAAKKQETPKRSKEERKREFLLGFNSYTVGKLEDSPMDKYYNWVFQGDGDYLIINNKIGKFTVKMTDIKHPGLPEDIGKSTVQLHVPKIPERIYNQIKSFFRDIADRMNDAEAFAQIYYDTRENKYIVHVPEQTVSKASVRYDAEKNLNEIDRDRYIFVFEVHSHNTMNAFFSGTDNGDEKETKFYGVMGKIKDSVIDEKYRFMVNGKEFLIDKSMIFDLTENKETYPATWNTNVKKYNYTPPKGTYSAGRQRLMFPHDDYHTDELPAHMHDPDYYMDDWDNYNNYYENNKKKDKTIPGSKGTSDESVDEIDVNDYFDLDTVEEEFRPLAIEIFTGSLTKMDIPILIESLVDRGFEYEIRNNVRQ